MKPEAIQRRHSQERRNELAMTCSLRISVIVSVEFTGW